MAKPVIDYGQFSGGLNADSAPHLLADNELQIAENVDLSTKAIRKRLGSVPLNAQAYGGRVHRLIEWPRNDGTTVWLAVVTVGSTATLNIVNKSTGALTQVCTLNKADIGWFWWQDKFYFGDSRYFRVYDGTAVHLVRLPTPEGTIAVSFYGTGSVPPGTHRWAVTFWDGASERESGFGKYIEATNDVTYKALISNIPIGPPDSGVIARKIYRTKVGDLNTYYLVGTINDNTTTTYTDTLADTSLGPMRPPVTADLGAVHRCNRFVFHPYSQRVFAAGNPDDKAALYYSKEGDPSEFRSTTWKVYPPSGFGPIQALALFGDALTVHWKQGHMRWKGVDPLTDVTWWQMPISVGVIAPLTLCLVPNALCFLGQGGPYIVSPAALESGYVLQSGESLLKNIAEGKWVSLMTGAADLTGACAVYDHLRERLMIAYKADAASPGNDRILVVEWDTQAAAIWRGIQVNHFCLTADGTLLAASDGHILKLNQEGTFTDFANGEEAPVEMRVMTKAFDLGQGKLRKKLFSLFLTTEPVEAARLDVTVFGGKEAKVFSSLAVGVGGPYEVRCSTKGERFSVLIENRLPQDARVNGVGFEFRPMRAKGKAVGE